MPAEPLQAGDTVRFRESTGRTWTGRVTAVRPDVAYVRWSDGVVGIFRREYHHRLERAA